jgi:tripartite-type tricarboxylate transporter receptor subunit TctC
LGQRDLQARLVAMGLQVRPQAAAQFSSFIKKEVEKWAAVIKESGVPQVD